MILNKDTLDEINTLEGRLNHNNGSFVQDLRNHSRVKKGILEDAEFHSAQLELPVLSLYRTGVPTKKKLQIRKERRRVIERLKTAWRWAMNCYTKPTHAFIQGVAAKISPELFNERVRAPYRLDAVRIQGGIYMPPRPEKVEREVEGMIKYLSQTPLHPVEVAAYSHFHIARIHPFSDGNGRTSRLVQNVHLVKNNLPPAVIHRGERNFYNQLIEDAVGAYNTRQAEENKRVSAEEIRFFEYVASKVLIGLETIARHDDLKRNK